MVDEMEIEVCFQRDAVKTHRLIMPVFLLLWSLSVFGNPATNVWFTMNLTGIVLAVSWR